MKIILSLFLVFTLTTTCIAQKEFLLLGLTYDEVINKIGAPTRIDRNSASGYSKMVYEYKHSPQVTIPMDGSGKVNIIDIDDFNNPSLKDQGRKRQNFIDELKTYGFTYYKKTEDGVQYGKRNVLAHICLFVDGGTGDNIRYYLHVVFGSLQGWQPLDKGNEPDIADTETDEYTILTNSTYGYKMQIPDGVFQHDKSMSGDLFYLSDGTASIDFTGTDLTNNETLESFYTAELKHQPGASYKKFDKTKRFFAVSSIQGEKVIYQKTYQQGNNILTVRAVFLVALKEKMNRIIEKISEQFHAQK